MTPEIMSVPRSRQPTPKNGRVRGIGLSDRIRDTCPCLTGRPQQIRSAPALQP